MCHFPFEDVSIIRYFIIFNTSWLYDLTYRINDLFLPELQRELRLTVEIHPGLFSVLLTYQCILRVN